MEQARAETTRSRGLPRAEPHITAPERTFDTGDPAPTGRAYATYESQLGLQGLLFSGLDAACSSMLTALGIAPALANVISSGYSISVVDLLVTRFTFGTTARAITYVAFIGWYAANIAVTSTAIGLAPLVLPAPLAWKLVSVPLSFIANYALSRLLLERITTPRAS